MANYLSREDFEGFIYILKNGNYSINKYLPPIGKEWYEIVYSCVEYVQNIAPYEGKITFEEECARLLYKVAKRHELGDGNKRTSVIVVYLFCVMNDYYISKPAVLKQQAKRAAATKGRVNEMIMRKRIASVLATIIRKMPAD